MRGDDEDGAALAIWRAVDKEEWMKSWTIERVANGWIVRPAHDIRSPVAITEEVHVFQELEYDDQGVMGEKTVFGFLKKQYA